ncbi:MAG: hypothetical protein ABUT20_58430 [Bacteroidota bacterium]
MTAIAKMESKLHLILSDYPLSLHKKNIYISLLKFHDMHYLLILLQTGSGSFFPTIIILAIIIFISFRYFKNTAAVIQEILGHSHHRFIEPPFSAQEFYSLLEKTIVASTIPTASVTRITYSEGGILAPNREYLRVKYKEFVFDICAAPFAKGYFVSWWLGETGNSFRDFLRRIPLIGRLFRKRRKTFFELDTEIMFKETIGACIQEAIDAFTEKKGLRKLTVADWQTHRQYAI